MSTVENLLAYPTFRPNKSKWSFRWRIRIPCDRGEQGRSVGAQWPEQGNYCQSAQRAAADRRPAAPAPARWPDDQFWCACRGRTDAKGLFNPSNTWYPIENFSPLKVSWFYPDGQEIRAGGKVRLEHDEEQGRCKLQIRATERSHSKENWKIITW